MKLVRLDKDYSIKVSSQVTNYLAPNRIYVPIMKNKEIPFKRNEEIRKEQEIFPQIYSPVSGQILGISDCTLCDGSLEKCLVIANDFEEKLKKRIATQKKLNIIKKEDLQNYVYDIDIAKFFSDANVEHIIISGIDDEPYLANEVFIQKNNTKLILEIVDALVNFFGSCKAHIVIKNTDSDNITNYNNYIGTFQNIELHLVEDEYLIGEEFCLTEKLHIKNQYLYLKASEVYALYYNLKKHRPYLEKYITITGDALDNPQVFNVKLGTKVQDIIDANYKINLEDYEIYVNGLMHGKKMNVANLIVTKNLTGLVIMKKTNIKPKSCIKCGKCLEVCPIHSNPLLAYESKKTVPCIGCGLCSYICPAYIPLKQYAKGDENE